VVVRPRLILPTALLLPSLACGFTDNRRPGPEVPSYEATMRSDTEIDVLTEATTPADLRIIFDEVHEDRTDGGWWEVTISCATIDPDTGIDPVLAVGRFANTHQGAREAGLDTREEVEFTTTDRSDCEPVAPAVPGAVTAEDVFAAVEAAGLDVLSPRDGSDACAELGCTERTVTDQFTVIVWPDEAEAARWAEVATLDVVLLAPVTTVQLNDGGFDPDGPERDRYLAAVEGAGA
jgi:hypothetical protein